MPKKQQPILILGGNGFLGQQLLASDLPENFSCSVVSRSGKPNTNFLIETLNHNITWIKSDVLQDDLWTKYLTEDTIILDLIGIFKEHKGQQTFKQVLQLTKKIAHTVEKVPIKKVIYLSAKSGPKKYIQNKRQCEKVLSESNNNLIIIRSGLLQKPARSKKEATLGILLTFLTKWSFLPSPIKNFQPTQTEILCQTIIDLCQTEEVKNKIINV